MHNLAKRKKFKKLGETIRMVMEILGTMVVEIPGIVVATWVVTEMV